ncbi:CPBP family intramembrane glutamic endopeptidase [Candidatus Protochlamydia sp. W-9]|uniref:CPBP family intramembrane glutamic endopeptidase n=1 Tax=Candidatus Protochlamydia sp. W-9 TaxID=1785087 RepID=UPI00096A8A63|nr:CPBP family intramembrane glutamic endopeptidase [Candidatus Protochlamydia sp. W-9]
MSTAILSSSRVFTTINYYMDQVTNYQINVLVEYSKITDIKQVAGGAIYGVTAIGTGLGCATLVLGSSKVFQILKPLFNPTFFLIPATQKTLIKILYIPVLSYYIFSICIVTPILEEIIFRDLIQTKLLKNKVTPFLKNHCPSLAQSQTALKISRIFFTSILFALVHAPQNGLQLFLFHQFGAGLIFGIAKERDGLFSATMAHSTFNFIFLMLFQIAVVRHIYFR